MSFKKPTTLLREAHVGINKALGLAAPADTRPRHTDTMSILGPGVTIAYKKRTPDNLSLIHI